MELSLSAVVEYACDNTIHCGKRMPGIMVTIDRNDAAGAAAKLHDLGREVAVAMRDAGYFNGEPKAPGAWLIENLPAGWRVTTIKTHRPGGALKTFVTCSQDCLDVLLGRLTTSADDDANHAAAFAARVADGDPWTYAWRIARLDCSNKVDDLLHLFPYAVQPGDNGALCDENLVRTGVTTAVILQRRNCPTCIDRREKLADARERDED